MKKLLRISADDSLSLPPDTVTSTLVVYGGKGMGKTVFGADVAEELDAAGFRWSWLDPLGVSWGTRHSANGKGPGVKCLILGGIHGDIPITPDAGAAVADTVVEETGNVLIDFSRTASGKMWKIGERIRFATDYAHRLFERQGELVRGHRRDPLMQFLDEGARYIPQIVPAGNPNLSLCVSAWQQLVEEGRNVGIGVCILTQRSARINKDVAELADAMIAFRTVGPRSRAAVMDWLGDHVEKERLKDLSEQVRKLPKGSALIVSPGWLEFEGVVPIRMRRTFDSSATPKAGQRARRTRGPGARPNLEKIRARMAEIIERAKAEDPKEIKKLLADRDRRIVELERQIAKKQAPVAVPTAVVKGITLKEFEVVVDRRHLEDVIETAESFEKNLGGFTKALEDVRRSANVSATAIRRARQTGPAALTKRLAKAPPPPVKRVRPDPGPSAYAYSEGAVPPSDNRRQAKMNGASSNGAVSIGGGLRRMMIALAQRSQGLTNRQLGVRAGLSSRSGTFSTYLSRARSELWITDHGEKRVLTEAGEKALGHWEPLPEGRALLEYWLHELGGGASRMLTALADAYPDTLTNEELGAAADISHRSGTFSTYLSKLRTLELVEGHGKLRMSEELSG